MKKHDIHDYLMSSHRDIQNEYLRILKRATEDPGTAGEQGQENWATLLRNWLPSYFHIVTNGRVLFENGCASPQIDVLILHPSYPRVLLDKKLYLAGGVAAAFECKTTLTAAHIKKAVETAANIKGNIVRREGTPYRELNSQIIYGLLSHSHSWRSVRSSPYKNVERTLYGADELYVKHPIQQIDFITVSDLATWQSMKVVFLNETWPNFCEINDAVKFKDKERCSSITIYRGTGINSEGQDSFLVPIAPMLYGLLYKLSWLFTDMREFASYFGNVAIPFGIGGSARFWPSTVFSEYIRNVKYNESSGDNWQYNEWHNSFF